MLVYLFLIANSKYLIKDNILILALVGLFLVCVLALMTTQTAKESVGFQCSGKISFYL